MKKKPRDKKKDEQKRTAAAYLLSLLFHALLFLLFGLLFGGGGGVASGGIEGSNLVPIGVVRNPGEPAQGRKVPVSTSSSRTTESSIDNRNVVTSEDSPVVVKDKKDKKERNEQEQVVKTKPRALSQRTEQPGEGPKSGAQTPGQGGGTGGSGGNERSADNGLGDGSGNSSSAGVGTGTGPFPFGVFNLDSVPDCKKDDADNDSLKFSYDVTYKGGDFQVVFSGGTVQADPATIEQTRRMIMRDFSPEKLNDNNKIYKGAIRCRCGSDPKCWLVK